jgi:hypothetical protein
MRQSVVLFEPLIKEPIHDSQQEDCETPERALVCLLLMIEQIPEHAGSIGEPILGKRADGAGGGWYWAISYSTGWGSVSKGRPSRGGTAVLRTIDRQRAMLEAVEKYRELVVGVEHAEPD